MRINPKDKMITEQRMEKWVIRKAFEKYLPQSVVWRQEQFSDGVGYSWIDKLQDITEQKVTDEQMKANKYFPINPPQSKKNFTTGQFFKIIFQVMLLRCLFPPNLLLLVALLLH